MKALCLFGVLLFARILSLLGRDVPLSFWSPIAYLWQDLMIVLLFAVVERFTARRPGVAWTVYSATTLYVALNLPLVRLMSSPMTWPMLRATRGTLADSIRHHLTGENLVLIGLVLGAAGVLPLLLQGVRLRTRVRVGIGIAAAVLVALGPLAATRVDTAGLHRNVFLALLETSVPRVAPEAMDADWRASPCADARLTAQLPEGENLSRFKAAAKGRNVVLILLESTAAQYLRPYGAAEDPMPIRKASRDCSPCSVRATRRSTLDRKCARESAPRRLPNDWPPWVIGPRCSTPAGLFISGWNRSCNTADFKLWPMPETLAAIMNPASAWMTVSRRNGC